MRRVAVFAVLLAACSACPELEGGTYDVTTVETFGDCGPQDQTVIVISPGGIPVPDMSDCVGTTTFSEDGCTASYDAVCDTSVGVVDVSGFTEVVTSDTATSELRLEVDGVCRSTYDVTYRLRP